MSKTALACVAKILRHAQAAGIACPPVRDRIGGEDRIASAYAVQRLNQTYWEKSRRRIGMKVGYGTPVAYRPMGLSEPGYGVLMSDRVYGAGDEVPFARFVRPKVEAETAIVLEHGLNLPDINIADLMRAAAYAVTAVEIVDVRIADWDITPVDAIADNMGAGAIVLGSVPRRLSDLNLDAPVAQLEIDGVVAAEGKGLNWVANPISAAAQVARWAYRQGQPLRAGDIIMAGALHMPIWCNPGTRIRSTVAGLGAVTFDLASETT